MKGKPDLRPLAYTGLGMAIGLAAGVIISAAGNKTTPELAKIPPAVEKPQAPPDAATRRDTPPAKDVEAPVPIVAPPRKAGPRKIEAPKPALTPKVEPQKRKPSGVRQRAAERKATTPARAPTAKGGCRQRMAQRKAARPAQRVTQSRPVQRQATRDRPRLIDRWRSRPRVFGRRGGRRFGRR